MPGGWGTVQRGLKKLKQRVCVNLVRFGKAKERVWGAGRGNPRHPCRLGERGMESRPAKKDSGVAVGDEPDGSWLREPAAHRCFGSPPRQCGQEVEGGVAGCLYAGETRRGLWEVVW